MPVENVNNISASDYKYVFLNKNQNVSGADNKPKMSTTTKVVLGTTLSALAAVGIYLTTKRIKSNVLESTKEAIESLKKLTYRKSANVGKNVGETIENVLGKNSGITPHSYDLSKEFPGIGVYRSFGGYIDGIVTKNGIKDGLVITDPVHRLIMSSISHNPTSGKRYGTILGFKNKIVSLEIPGINGNPNYKIVLLSPNQNYTQLQKDAIKLIEHPEKIDLEVFDKITKFKDATDAAGKVIIEDVGKYENLDYDLILSAIQSMAKGL